MNVWGIRNSGFCAGAWAILSTVVVLLAATQATARPAEGSGTALRRFALLAGSNYGGLDRVRLKYAESDARMMAKVLTELGGVVRQDRVLALDPSPIELRQAFARVARRIRSARAAHSRVEFVFYYSGHSDEAGLLLGGRLVTYPEVRDMIRSMPADVRVAVLDSCASGAFTRTKGVIRRRAFLVDSSTKVRGDAVLTSAAANEAAQESDRIGGSFFTHYLVSGLRGAADVSQDGKITLSEAYQYAFNETLARTELTHIGPQHPNYDFQLAGSGDLILTDLRGTSAQLVLGTDVAGRLFIRDAKGQLVAEVNKPGNQPMSLGLEPGRYQITLDDAQRLRRGSIEIREGSRTPLQIIALEQVTGERTTARGDGEAKAEVELSALADELILRPFHFSLAPEVGTHVGGDKPVLNNVSLNLTVGKSEALSGFEASLVGSIRSGPIRGVQLSTVFNIGSAPLHGAQLAGIFNIHAGPLRGVQGAGIFNVHGGPAWGAQLAGIYNIHTGPLNGVGASGVFNIYTGPVRGVLSAGAFNVYRGDFRGMAVSGVFNFTPDPMVGVQASACFNLSRSIHGLQAAVLNVAADDARGVQAGVVNWAGDVIGGQAGIFNLSAGEMRGVQAGVVNIAGGEVHGVQAGVLNFGRKVKGLTVGLINVAEEMDGVPIGLVNLIGDGLHEADFWMSETSLLNAGFKMGSHQFYSILGASIHPEAGHERWSLFAGLGGRFDLNSFLWIELDLITHQLQQGYTFGDELDLLNKLRLKVGWQLAGQLAVYGGLSLNVLVSQVRDHIAQSELVFVRACHQTQEVCVEIAPGFLIGLQI